MYLRLKDVGTLSDKKFLARMEKLRKELNSLAEIDFTTSTHDTSVLRSWIDRLDVVAPGSNIYTSYYDSLRYFDQRCGYIYNSGTSFAAPHVSAIAALILSVAPQLTGAQVVHLIQQSAQKISNYNFSYAADINDGTWNSEIGYGLVDAYAALVTDINEDFNDVIVNVDGCYVNIGDCFLNYDSELVIKCYVCTQITGKFEIEQGGQFLVNTSFHIY